MIKVLQVIPYWNTPDYHHRIRKNVRNKGTVDVPFEFCRIPLVYRRDRRLRFVHIGQAKLQAIRNDS